MWPEKNKFKFANWTDIPITELRLDGGFERSPWQEKYFREAETESLSRLADSLKRDGMRVPALAVMHNGSTVLLAGFRRAKVALQLGWESIPCRIHPGPLTEAQQEWIVLDDNVNRRGGSSIGGRDGGTAQGVSRAQELIAEIDPQTAAEIKLGTITSKELRKRTGVSQWTAQSIIGARNSRQKDAVTKSNADRYPKNVDKSVMVTVQKYLTTIMKRLRHANEPTTRASIVLMRDAVRAIERSK